MTIDWLRELYIEISQTPTPILILITIGSLFNTIVAWIKIFTKSKGD